MRPLSSLNRQTANRTDLTEHGFDILKASANALLNGHIQGASTGDTHMLPGTFIVDRDGIIRYAYYSKYAGDDPAIEVLMEQAKTLPNNGSQ